MALSNEKLEEVADRFFGQAWAEGTDTHTLKNLPVLGACALSATASLLSIARSLTWLTDNADRLTNKGEGY